MFGENKRVRKYYGRLTGSRTRSIEWCFSSDHKWPTTTISGRGHRHV